MKRMFSAVASLIGLLVVGFVVANLWVGGDSTATVEAIARSNCVKDGFPAETMGLVHLEADDHLFGFGGRATVVFGRDGKFLRVELRKIMNLTGWETVSVVEEKGQ